MPADQLIIQALQTINSVQETSSPFILLAKNLFFAFWWIPLPFIFYPLLRWAFVFYMETNYAVSRKKVILEVKIPEQVVKPLRAMENFFNSFWTSYDPPSDWRTTFFEGKIIMGTSFEMVSIEGTPHFFIRTVEGARKLLEATLYAQYPQIELFEVPDYVATIPQDLPNKDWDMWGCDFMPLKPDIYPLRTYSDFWEEKPDVPDEEKRLDPLSSILELFSKMGKGEYIWFQINARPISVEENDFVSRGKKEVDRLLKRGDPSSTTSGGPESMLTEFIKTFINFFLGLLGPRKDEEKKQELFPGAMLLSPGERDVISAIERKISKTCYECNLRFIYLARKDVFNPAMKAFGPSFTAQFGTQNTNGLKPWKMTITKIQSPDYFKESRLFIKKRNMFLRYRERDPAPGGTFILNTEELATIFHFPGHEVAQSPALERIEVKKVAPPISLPVEE
jgi:hypothetical protein